MSTTNGLHKEQEPQVKAPASNTKLPGSHSLPTVALPTCNLKELADPDEIASGWIKSFNSLLNSGLQRSDFSGAFLESAHWRDLLCFTWDFRTLQGRNKITEFAEDFVAKTRTVNFTLDQSAAYKKPALIPLDFDGNVKCLQAWLNVETDVGRGRGIVKFVPDASDGDKWKAFTLFTTLEELKGHEELIKERRPAGVKDGQDHGAANWKDKRDAEQKFEDGREPAVLILGAGQGGLTLAARLKQLDISTLIIDRNGRVGDNWRNRYHQLVLHDSVCFPPNWPMFTPKDKLAEWFEYYALAMELNIWTSTTLTASSWSDAEQKWTVTLERKQGDQTSQRTFHPRHIVLATGHSGEPSLPTDISGIQDFRGDRLCHSSAFDGPKPDSKGKKAVVVGSCNSGHDIARDYYEHGYDVTMVQRSSTLVLNCQTIIDVTMKGLYSEDGPPTPDADLLAYSLPTPIAKTIHAQSTREMLRRDAPLLNQLTAAGFALDSGPDEAGLWIKYLSRGGGYYIDVGTSPLLATRAIALASGPISHLTPHHVHLASGTALPADEIVFATGYLNMRDSARKIFGAELADRVGDVWGFDGEGEVRAMYRAGAGGDHPGFWFFGGNLALCRFYSRLVALQIKAREVGIV
ncbi:MAG: hypothetical protein Q9195_005374 [Heterodermia aff. obscurata]